MGRGGGLVLLWGDGKFLKSLYIVDKGVLTPYFAKTPYIAYPCIHILSTPPLTSLSLPTPFSFCRPVSLAE